MGFVFLILAILFMVILYVALHFHYKGKRDQLFRELTGKKYDYFEHVRLDIHEKSGIRYREYRFRADVVLYENTVILFKRRFRLFGLLNLHDTIVWLVTDHQPYMMSRAISEARIVVANSIKDNTITYYTIGHNVASIKAEFILTFKPNGNPMKKSETDLTKLLIKQTAIV